MIRLPASRGPVFEPGRRDLPRRLFWNAWPKQRLWLLAARSVTFTLAGGARGPGKTETGIVYMIDNHRTEYARFAGQVIRRDFQDLTDWLARSVPFYKLLGGEWRDQKKFWQFPGGARVYLGHLHGPNSADAYKGQERQAILFEELTQLALKQDFLKLAGSCRSTIGLAPTMFCTTNPDGAGHQWVKKFWGLGKAGACKPGVIYPAGPGFETATKIYIPGVVQDNPTLMEADPGYVERLKLLDERMYRAWALGDWDAFDGLVFQLRDEHVCEPFEVPRHWPLLCTFDWGHSKPFSFGWWTVDGEGALFRIAEWYGARRDALSGEIVHDQGLQLSDTEIAEGLAEHERHLPVQGGMTGRGVVRLADPTIFNKRKNFEDGTPIPSTAEVFARHGFHFRPGDPDRRQKYRQLHARLRVPQGALPALRVFSTCTEFLRTIPALAPDPHNMEDVDTRLEDHVYDETGHAVMAYPIGVAGGAAASEAAAAEEAIARAVARDRR